MNLILGHEPSIATMLIHKVTVPMVGVINEFKLPTFSKIRRVRVNVDYNEFEIWYEVEASDYNSEDFHEKRMSLVRSKIFTTGQSVPEEYAQGYLETFFLDTFVYHLYAYMVDGYAYGTEGE